MNTSDFDYQLLPEKIAQTPLVNRDDSRLMVISTSEEHIEHRHFHEISSLLQSGDILVFNDSRVIPARLWGTREGGGKVEILLLRHINGGLWECLTKPAKRVSQGKRIRISDRKGDFSWVEIVEKREEGVVLLDFSNVPHLENIGEIPLPPYIHAPLEDPERYQTVYARVRGSVAAPTAGLHFTPRTLETLKEKNVDFAFVTLHVGLGSFRPVRDECLQEHRMHQEYGEIPENTAQKLNIARAEGRRIICVGTTTVRLLEDVALKTRNNGNVSAFKGWINLFILPGFTFQVTNALLTNFHLPKSTLLMLVSAFAGSDLIQRAYEEARISDYRFYSFGDAMLILS